MNTSDYDICREGDTLTPDQARLLVSPPGLYPAARITPRLVPAAEVV